MDAVKVRAELVKVVPSDDFLWRELGEAAPKPATDEEQDMEPVTEEPEVQGIALHAGESVTVSRMISSRTLLELMEYSNAVAGYNTDRAEKAGGDPMAFFRIVDTVYAPLSKQIIDWTWTNPITGEALPKPHNNPEVFAELDVQHITYLYNLVMGASTKNPKKS